METISQGLMAKLGLNMSGFSRGLGKAVQDARSAGTRINAGFAKIGRAVKRATIAVAAFAAAGAALTIGFTRSVIQAADTSEQFRLRLNAMLGSVEEGAKTFEAMTKFASRVPFEFEEIMASATQLAGIVKGGSAEIAQLMPLIADLAAVSGLSIQQTTEQIVRSFAAGIGAADLFRERGISAMLGFQAGATVSAADTRRQIIDEWNKMGSQFRGASEDLATTWSGITSMMSDRWFQFKNLVADAGLFDLAKQAASGLVEKLNELADTGRLNEFAQKTSDTIVNLVNSTVRGFAFVAQRLIGVIEFFQSKPLAGGFGLVGLVFLGPGGALALGAIGLAIDTLMEKLIGPTTVAGNFRQNIAEAKEEARRLAQELANSGDATGEIAARMQVLNRAINMNTRLLGEMGDEAGVTFGDLRTLLEGLEDFSLESLFGGKGAGGEAVEVVAEINRQLLDVSITLDDIVTTMPEFTNEMNAAFLATVDMGRETLALHLTWERIGQTIEDRVIGAVVRLADNFGNMLDIVQDLGRAIMREIVAALARAVAEGKNLNDVMSGISPVAIGAAVGSFFGPIGTVLGGFVGSRFHEGGIVRPQRFATAGGNVPAILEAGEVVLSRHTVNRLGGPVAANQLNQGGAAGGGVTFVFDASRLPAASNPLAAARDGDWVAFLSDSIRAWEENGGRLAG